VKRTAVYVGNDRVLLRTVNGYKMFVDARDVSIAPHLILDGAFEEYTDAVLRTIVRPGMHILEIGANVGVFTLLMAHRTGSKGSVLSFECDPELAQLVRDNLEINGLAHIGSVDERAVSDSAGTMRFFSAIHHRGNGTLVEGLEQIPRMNLERREIEVQSTTVDAIVKEYNRRFDLVKIDAEGAETAILRGGSTLFADRGLPLRVIVEFAPAFISSAGDDPAAYLDRFEAYGFTIERIDERRKKALPVTRDALLATHISDLLLTRS
jgi:FkbM family methyltransferase